MGGVYVVADYYIKKKAQSTGLEELTPFYIQMPFIDMISFAYVQASPCGAYDGQAGSSKIRSVVNAVIVK